MAMFWLIMVGAPGTVCMIGAFGCSVILTALACMLVVREMIRALDATDVLTLFSSVGRLRGPMMSSSAVVLWVVVARLTVWMLHRLVILVV